MEAALGATDVTNKFIYMAIIKIVYIISYLMIRYRELTRLKCIGSTIITLYGFVKCRENPNDICGGILNFLKSTSTFV